MSNAYIPKEISWLSFNERVLQEAENKNVPLVERFKFLGIYSNNLDEYFRVRVATLKRLSLFGNKAKMILGYNPKATLKRVHEIVLAQNERFEKTYKHLLKELNKQKIYIINEEELDSQQALFVQTYFHMKVLTRLMPLILTRDAGLPNLTDDAIYFAILLNNSVTDKKRYALLEIPTILPRFLLLPERNGEKFIIFLDDIIRYGMKELFFIFQFDEIVAYTIKLTKDAELDIADDISESYIEKISKSLQQRKKGSAVRLVHDRNMPPELLRILTKKLNLGPDDAIIPGDRYHNLKDLIKFNQPEGANFRYKPLAPILHRYIQQGKSILSVIRKKDLMIHFPYHPFDHFIDLLREASIDPTVTSIEITLYRLARNSSVINALLNAARNGKRVTTVVELQARFDEEANILWGKKLIDEGVKVIYGVPGLKVHSKLCLITREKNHVKQRFAAVGTGNFNEETARVYTDHLLLTSDKKITNEVVKVFNFFVANYRKEQFYHLLLSPFYLRNKIMMLIEKEIKNVKAGKSAYISIKINNLTDEEIIGKIYEAASAGVDIRLIVRGMLSLVPGTKGELENLKAISIVDQYLEHSRYLIFCNGGNELVYITSADIMPRNLDRRIEVTCPIYDESIKKEIRDVFEIQWSDTVKARIYDETQSNSFVKESGSHIRSQIEVHKYLLKAGEVTGDPIPA